MRSSQVLLLVLALAACGQEKVYKIGVVARGSANDGAQMAAREANSKEGVRGVALRVVLADTVRTGKPDTARVIDKLASDTTVKVILEEASAGVSPAVLGVFSRHALPALVLGPALGRTDNRWVFHLMPPVDEEARLMAAQAQRLWQPKRVAIVHSSDPYGVVLSGALHQALPAAMPVVLDTPFVEIPDTAMVAALERTIRAANPDVLFWLGPPRVLGIMVARMREHLPELRIMGSEKVEGKRIYDNADGIFSGLVFVRAADPDVDTARYNEFQYRFSMWQGGQGTSEALLAYDAASVVIQALRDGALSRQQVRDYLASLGHARPAYKGITGPISFDSAGVLRRSLGLAEVQDEGVKAVPLAQVAIPTATSGDTAQAPAAR